jgi:anti-anti-sigma factor
MMTDRGDRIHTLQVAGELDMATADDTAAQGGAAIARHAGLLLLDLTRLSFCDAHGLSALVRIANHCESAAWTSGCRYSRPLAKP